MNPKMDVKIHTADYIKSAPALKDCPDFGGMPEIVLVGRSNVGKSSFINSLTARKNLARTSNTPGKTRYINFYKILFSVKERESNLLFVDLPGYGYAKVSKTEQETWRRNLEAYLLKREPIVQIIQLIDARHGAQDNDVRMFEWLQHHGKPVQIVLTKADKLSRNEQSKHVAQTARELDLDARDFIVFSAENHQGRAQAWEKLLQTLSS